MDCKAVLVHQVLSTITEDAIPISGMPRNYTPVFLRETKQEGKVSNSRDPGQKGANQGVKLRGGV